MNMKYTAMIITGLGLGLAPAITHADDANAGDRVERHLDAQGNRINAHLDRKGERIEHRLDVKGDRINRRLDHRGEQIERHFEHRREHAAGREDAPGRRHARRHVKQAEHRLHRRARHIRR